MESSEASPIGNAWRLGFLNHARLAIIAVIVSGVLMSRVKGGWSFEPLIWLALVWYFGLLFLVDFIIFRGRGRIKTLLVILTGVAVVIMFPFSAIRKAEYRARIGGELEQHGRIEKAQLLEQWNWWELPTGECIPHCLAWRVPVDGIHRQTFLSLDAKDVANFPKWLVDEVEILNYYADGLQPRLIRHRLAPSSIAISSSSEQVTFGVDQSSRLQEKWHEKNIDWIEQVVSFERCATMELHRVRASMATWSRLLSSKSVQELRVSHCQIPDENWLCDLPQLRRLDLSKEMVGSQGLKKLISGSPDLKEIVISVTQLTSEFAKVVAGKNDLEVVVMGANGSRPLRALQVNPEVVFDGKVKLVLCEFDSLNFTDPHLQTLIRSTESTEFTVCELSFRNVRDIVDFEPIGKADGYSNFMDSDELQLLLAWIAEQSGDSKILASKIDDLEDFRFYLQDPNATEVRGLFELIRRKVKK